MTRQEKLAQRMARACRLVIEDVLYQWEVRDAEEEFYKVILAGLQEAGYASGNRNQAGQD